jgi:hypothetical protein
MPTASPILPPPPVRGGVLLILLFPTARAWGGEDLRRLCGNSAPPAFTPTKWMTSPGGGGVFIRHVFKIPPPRAFQEQDSATCVEDCGSRRFQRGTLSDMCRIILPLAVYQEHDSLICVEDCGPRRFQRSCFKRHVSNNPAPRRVSRARFFDMCRRLWLSPLPEKLL